MPRSEADRLLEMLLTDPEFRARFDADPSGAARAAGLERLATELAGDVDRPMQTLELRESRSSLAGAMVAAAAEGVELLDFGGAGAVSPSESPALRLAAQAEQQAQQPVAHAQAAGGTAPPAPVDPDDFEGNADDEDAGEDEQDGSDEDEPHEVGDDEDDDDSEDEDDSDDEDDEDDEDDDNSGSDDDN